MLAPGRAERQGQADNSPDPPVHLNMRSCHVMTERAAGSVRPARLEANGHRGLDQPEGPPSKRAHRGPRIREA